MKENSKEKSKLSFVIDTNVLLSAIRYKGEAFKFFILAEKAGCKIFIPKYVYEEIKVVFERKE